MTTHNLTELRSRLGTVVRQAVAHPDEDQIITDNGTAVAVIVPIAELRRLREQAWEAELLRRSHTPVEYGVPHEQAIAEAERRLAERGR
ncbi:MAG TPA: type II toxin-antitoxin system Phd/YefM family antitoxin [Micromonosporaceae bacterium]|jgi:prevent-host-death family protein